MKKLSPSRALAAKLLHQAFIQLKQHGPTLHTSKLFQLIEESVELDEWATELYEATGNTRWQSILHFFSINAVKAGFLEKVKGDWTLTSKGAQAVELGHEGILEAVTDAYKRWRIENPRLKTETDEDVIEKKILSEIELNGVRFWKVSCGLGGRYSADHKRFGVISLGWDGVPDITKFKTVEEIINHVESLPETEFDKVYATKTCWAFAHDIKPGDFIMGYGSGAVLQIGTVEGPYEFLDVKTWASGSTDRVDDSQRHIRRVNWLDLDTVETSALSPELKKKMVRNQTMFELTEAEGTEILKRAGFTEEARPVQKARQDAKPKITIEDLVSSSGKSKEFLTSLERRLIEKRQVVLYGPPGTSKTHLALMFSHFFQDEHSRFERVQFHPSYSYEDFIEGYRPQDKGAGFEVQSGIFKDFCREAQRNPNSRHVFLIDEINRGNLAQIFGELLYLLEYRNEEVLLTYSKTKFSIPDNVYLVATMNSADRSIALVDYALRRRFDFFELPADENVLRAYLAKNNCKVPIDAVVGFFRKVNEIVTTELGKHYAVGHTYFMKKDMTFDTLQDIWRYSIAPLMDEYFFNNDGLRQSLTLDSMLQSFDPTRKAA